MIGVLCLFIAVAVVVVHAFGLLIVGFALLTWVIFNYFGALGGLIWLIVCFYFLRKFNEKNKMDFLELIKKMKEGGMGVFELIKNTFIL